MEKVYIKDDDSCWMLKGIKMDMKGIGLTIAGAAVAAGLLLSGLQTITNQDQQPVGIEECVEVNGYCQYYMDGQDVMLSEALAPGMEYYYFPFNPSVELPYEAIGVYAGVGGRLTLIGSLVAYNSMPVNGLHSLIYGDADLEIFENWAKTQQWDVQTVKNLQASSEITYREGLYEDAYVRVQGRGNPGFPPPKNYCKNAFDKLTADIIFNEYTYLAMSTRLGNLHYASLELGELDKRVFSETERITTQMKEEGCLDEYGRYMDTETTPEDDALALHHLHVENTQASLDKFTDIYLEKGANAAYSHIYNMVQTWFK
ncbi:hypothetical protein JXB41_03650 [Candidatus Woesearchaeota archaeon]|nr:hypothetical protein [Candidatus Woesearchaeota archaeon]